MAHSLDTLHALLTAMGAVLREEGVFDALFGQPTPFDLGLVVSCTPDGQVAAHGRGIGVSRMGKDKRYAELCRVATQLIDAVLVLEGVRTTGLPTTGTNPGDSVRSIQEGGVSAHALLPAIDRVRAHLATLGWDGKAWTLAMHARCAHLVAHGIDALHPRYSSWRATQDGHWADKEAPALALWDTWRKMGMR